MTFCREMGMTYTAYLDQPADVMLAWQEYRRVEMEAGEMRQKIETAQSTARSRLA